MHIRWKLFALLAAFALVPLVIKALHGHSVLGEVAREGAALAVARAESLVVAAALGGIAVLGAFFAAHAATGTVRALVDAAQRLARGDFQARVAVRGFDELGRLGRLFNRLVPEFKESVRARRSLEIAREVQRHLLPAERLDIGGVCVAATTQSCDETGGDYYDVLELSRGRHTRVGLAVGDVSGHGIAAALLMAGGRALIRSAAADAWDPGHLMSEVNRHLSRDVHEGRFMTALLVSADVGRRRLTWSSAGHGPGLLYLPAEDRFVDLTGSDIPLGIESDWEYRAHELSDWRGPAVVVLTTDGLWEMRNPAGEMFGTARLRAIVRNGHGDGPEALRNAITSALAQFRSSAPLNDDVTVMVAEIPSDPKPMDDDHG